MNVLKARELSKEGREEKRINVLHLLDNAIEEAAKRHQVNETITLTSRPYNFSKVLKADHIYRVPVDQESVKFYLDHFRLAGFKVDELFCNANEARLHISWEDE